MLWMLTAALLGTAPAEAGGRCYARGGGITTIDYVSAEEEAEKARRRADATMSGGVDSIGAYVYVSIQRPSLDLALEDQHSVVIVKDGREVARRRGSTGPEGVPGVPVGTLNLWRGGLLVTVPAPPFEVYAIDHIFAHRCGWRVEADGKVRKMKRREMAH